MQKKEIFAILTNPTRNKIISRLHSATKAAYSDLLDSSGYQQVLSSTGNFNYHLNYLQELHIIYKEGSLYQLTAVGKELAKMNEIITNQSTHIEQIMRGEKMSVFTLAEHFEMQTHIPMLKEKCDFQQQGMDMILDEDKTIGIIPLTKIAEKFVEYELLPIEKWKIQSFIQDDEYREGDEDKDRDERNNKIDRDGNNDGKSDGEKSAFDRRPKKPKVISLLTHTRLQYQLSPKWLGIIQDYLETAYGHAYLYANPTKPSPFLVSSHPITEGSNTEGCLFVIAPAVVDPALRKSIPPKS